MLDTIKLHLNDWVVRDGAKLEISGSKTDYSTGEVRENTLFYSENGGKVLGSKAFLNSEKLNLTIKPLISGGIGAFVQCSLPKLYRGSNYNPLRAEDINPALDAVRAELHLNGIDCDLNGSGISRLDLFRNILPAENVASYGRVFELLNARHIRDKRTYGVAGWLYSNTQQELAIYEKRAEMLRRREDVRDIPETLRFENRALKGEKVRDSYSCTTVQDLKNKGWDAIEAVRRKSWEALFRYSIPELLAVTEDQLKNALRYYQAEYGRFFLSRYFKAYGASSILRDIGGYEIFRSALKDIGANRKMIYRAERDIKSAIFELEYLRPDGNCRVTLGDLYDELKVKVLSYE